METGDTVLEAYFDESGHTGEDACHPVQQNLLFAAVVVPSRQKDAFWTEANLAWELASQALERSAESIELKGSDLYGGKGLFGGVDLDTRKRILEVVFGANELNGIRVMWLGGAKHLWPPRLHELGLDRRDHPLLHDWLFAFCNGLYEVLATFYSEGIFDIVGDENEWCHADRRLVLPGTGGWQRMYGEGVTFLSSSQVRGLQVADVMVHTLYRANKSAVPNPAFDIPRPSNTDKLAESFHGRLEDNGSWLDIYRFVSRLRTVIGET